MPTGHDIVILKDRYMKNPSKNSILAAQAFGFRYLTKKVSVVSLKQGMLLALINASTKYNKNISNHLEVMKCTRIWLRKSFGEVNLKKQPSKEMVNPPTAPQMAVFFQSRASEM